MDSLSLKFKWRRFNGCIPDIKMSLKNASGPFTAENGKLDLIDLIVGSEGIFGCITNVDLKLKIKSVY